MGLVVKREKLKMEGVFLMRGKIVCIILVVIMLVGCSQTVRYKYDEFESQNGDWILESGRVSIRDGDDSIIFKIKYNSDEVINKGESWSCDLLICEENKGKSIDEADVIFSRIDVYANAIEFGDVKVVKTDNDVLNTRNDYDFDNIYLKIVYTLDNEERIDIIEISL